MWLRKGTVSFNFCKNDNIRDVKFNIVKIHDWFKIWTWFVLKIHSTHLWTLGYEQPVHRAFKPNKCSYLKIFNSKGECIGFSTKAKWNFHSRKYLTPKKEYL